MQRDRLIEIFYRNGEEGLQAIKDSKYYQQYEPKFHEWYDFVQKKTEPSIVFLQDKVVIPLSATAQIIYDKVTSLATFIVQLAS